MKFKIYGSEAKLLSMGDIFKVKSTYTIEGRTVAEVELLRNEFTNDEGLKDKSLLLEGSQ